VILEIFLAGCIVGFSVLLFVTSLISYSRLRHARFAYVAVAFLMFLVKGILSLAGELSGSPTVSLEMLVIDLLILLFLYLAVAKR
jgi:hypothetical protein